MARSNRRRRDAVPLDLDRVNGGTRTESRGGRDYAVRALSGTHPTKVYRCPGCQQEFSGAVPHVVVWPTDGLLGPDARRHWHTPCWRRS